MAESCVSESSQSDDDLPSIGDDPFQPRSIKFPKRSFREKKPVLRSFQSAWVVWMWRNCFYCALVANFYLQQLYL